MHFTVPFRLYHRHRIDKYLDTLLSNQTSRTVKPPITAERVSRKMADCPVLPNQSQRSKSSVITDERSRSLSAHWPGLAGFFGHWLAVVLVIFQRPSCGLTYSGGFRFHCRYCSCVVLHCTGSEKLNCLGSCRDSHVTVYHR